MENRDHPRSRSRPSLTAVSRHRWKVLRGRKLILLRLQLPLICSALVLPHPSLSRAVPNRPFFPQLSPNFRVLPFRFRAFFPAPLAPSLPCSLLIHFFPAARYLFSVSFQFRFSSRCSALCARLFLNFLLFGSLTLCRCLFQPFQRDLFYFGLPN